MLHEFLGDQDVRVLDKSSDNKWAGISYENEGTWYDVGFGFATMMSKNSYAFLDLENPSVTITTKLTRLMLACSGALIEITSY